jgi:PAS domain S-box-containing protein
MASLSDTYDGDAHVPPARAALPARTPEETDPNAAVVAVDRDGLVTRWSPGAERLFGWDAAEVLGRRLPTIPRHAEAEFERLRATILGGRSVDRVVRRVRKDGTIVEVNVNVVPTPSRELRTEIVGMLAVITKLAAAERPRQEVRRAAGEDRLRAVVGASPLAIIEYELDGRVRLWNRAAEQIFGWASEEVVGSQPPVVPREHRLE